MKKLTVLSFVASVLVLSSVLIIPSIANADRPIPPNDRARGLVYDGLEVPRDGECKGAFKVKVNGAKAGDEPQCTHGPDPFTPLYAFAKPTSPTPAPSPATTSGPGTVMCDGDGVTGKRVQVLYTRASTAPSRYAEYLPMFQQWAAEADSYFNTSAAQTGGSRRIRFVHDASCKPVVTEVVLSTWGTQSFSNMISELNSLGYNSRDRKYLIFMDAAVYCGIGSIVPDDSPSKGNKSNVGPHYARVDVNCWSGVIAAHELMHTFGGVQLSAPHSDGNWHCTDGFDNMCNRGGQVVQTICADTANGYLMDCNHDDYFSTNPPANSYLATRWNTANNQFLIAPSTSTKR